MRSLLAAHAIRNTWQDPGHVRHVGAYDKIAPDLSKRERDKLEGAGMTPRQIDDIVARLRVQMPNGFTRHDVLAVVRQTD
jgi:hypothetical protein